MELDCRMVFWGLKSMGAAGEMGTLMLFGGLCERRKAVVGWCGLGGSVSERGEKAKDGLIW